MSNPALSEKVFAREAQGGGTATSGRPPSPADELPPGIFAAPATQAGYGAPPAGPVANSPVSADNRMRLSGTMTATAILLALVVVAGWFGWQAVTVTDLGVNADGTQEVDVSMPPWLIIGWIGGFIIAVVTIFKPKIARFTGPIYAIAQGLFLGAISRAFEVQFDGIVLQAVLLTLGVFLTMLILFATGTIRVTEKLRMMIIASTVAIMLVYLVSIVMSFFGSGVPMIHDSGPIGIGFSLLVVGIASFNLLLDFDFVKRGVEAGAPRYMEWFAAFGLMITLIWLYLEILRLLGKLRN